MNESNSKFPDIASALKQFSRGARTPTQLVQQCLKRIEKVDPQLRAWVDVDTEGALKRAGELTRELQEGKPIRPLHGIPIGIKDIIDLEGQRTGAGSNVRLQHRAERDATVVSRLKSAGAIILGKTVTTQFACFDPAKTLNPWNPNQTPGGSSSGSAAAVSARMCLAAIGTQTGGSINRPATYCGVAGFKPAFDTTQMEGIIPVSRRLDHVGPIAHTVQDLFLIWREMIPNEQKTERFEDSISFKPTDKFDLIQLKEFWEPNSKLAAEVLSICQATIDSFDIGAPIASHDMPASFENVQEMHRTIMAHDAALVHQKDFQNTPELYSPQITSLIVAGNKISQQVYKSACAHQRLFRREMSQILERSVVAVLPATNSPAPGVETTGDPKFNSPWSYCGFPTISLPCGLTSQGLPVGIQLLAAPGQESAMFTLAQRLEQSIGFEKLPPL